MSDPVAGPTVALGGASRLMNYEEWIKPHVEVMPFQPSILDSFLYSTDIGNGLVEEAVEYPREWPAQWLDGAIPEFTGTGWMFDLFVVRPYMSYAANDLKHVAVTVYDYLPEEVDAYIAGLLASGFVEIMDNRYAGDWINSKRAFRGENCTLNILFAHGDWPVYYISTDGLDPDTPLPFVQFNVDFFREPYKLNTAPTQGTELLNYEQWFDQTGMPTEQRKEMDQLVDSETDEYDRLNETIYLPSKWPKDIFGEVIPEYDYPGVMYFIDVTTPQENPMHDQTFIATMYVLEYNPLDVEKYAQRLVDFGYREIPWEEYTEQEVAEVSEYDIFHIFALPSVRVYLGTFVDEVLQITLRFDGRYYNFFNE